MQDDVDDDLWEKDYEENSPETETLAMSDSRKRFFKNARTGVAFAVVLAIGFAGGWYAHTPLGESVVSNVPLLGDGLNATPDSSLDFTDFWKVYNILNTQYVITHASSTIPTDQEKMWGAIEGLTASYGDPYTVFFPPAQAKAFNDNITGKLRRYRIGNR